MILLNIYPTAVLTLHMKMYVAVFMATQCWQCKLRLVHSLKYQFLTVYVCHLRVLFVYSVYWIS